ncbi:hypothetical protein J6590_090509, partial [Homalodisca vitripennis]
MRIDSSRDIWGLTSYRRVQCGGYGGYRRITESSNIERGCFLDSASILSLQAARLPGRWWWFETTFPK